MSVDYDDRWFVAAVLVLVAVIGVAFWTAVIWAIVTVVSHLVAS